MATGLWDDIEAYVITRIGEGDHDVTLLEAEVPREQAQGSPFGNGGDAPAEPVVSEAPALRIIPDAVTVTQQEVAASGGTVDPVAVSALPIRDDVQHIKERYILGKRLGRDLADVGGQLIARQGELITKSVMERAEDAGKLVELIVHMTFNDTED